MVRGFRHEERPGDAWPSTDGDDYDTEHERNTDVDYEEYDEARERMPQRSAGQRRARRPILPMEVAMAGLAGQSIGQMIKEQAKAAGTERFGSEPPIGSVLRWEAMGRVGRGTGQMLTYLGIRTPKGWWTTHDANYGAQTWAQMVSWIGDNPCSVATGWTEIPAPEPEPQGDDVVAAWASQFRRAEPVTRHLGDADGGETAGVEDDREPRFDAEGRDRNGWTRAELGEDDDSAPYTVEDNAARREQDW